MFSALKHKDDQKLDWRDYTDDEIMGMHWRWRYAPYNADIAKIWCFCPVDDTELIYQEGFSVSFPTVSFRCETCGAEFGPFNGDRHHVIGMAQRQIRLSFKLMSGKQLLSDCANMAEYCQKLLLSA